MLGTLRFLIHDRDRLLTAAVEEVFKAEGLRVIPTLPGTPRMNAICDRVIGALRRSARFVILAGSGLVLTGPLLSGDAGRGASAYS